MFLSSRAVEPSRELSSVEPERDLLAAARVIFSLKHAREQARRSRG